MSVRVFLGLSGGVDSALSAALLAEQGYDVTCIYMRNWSRDLPGFACPWADELADAERVAVTLGLPLEVWDCEREYKETVVDYLVDAYARGFTPNPDVMCNQTVKFGTFAEKAFAAGADLIATGHYAAVEHRSDGPAILSRAADEHKDQTYFLWRVPGEILNRALFPMAEIPSKAVAREMCRERRISVADKPDSDGICFIGPVGLRTFLLDSLERRAGDIVDWETGAVLGRHDGAFLFTVGQRKGLDLGGGPARYVVGTDTSANIVYVTADLSCPALWTCEDALEDAHWIAGEPPEPGDYLVSTRHTGTLRHAQVEMLGDGRVLVRWPDPVRTVAPGQSAVIYDGRTCLGGGIIATNKGASRDSQKTVLHGGGFRV